MVRKVRRKVINHFGDWTNYPYSNWLYQNHIKPPRNIDRDGDGIVDWEDCDPYDYNKQGIWKSIKNVVSNIGKAISNPNGGNVQSVTQSKLSSLGVKTYPSSSSNSSVNNTSVKVGSGGGTYNPSTNTYVDSSGQGYSIASGTIPAGASVTPQNRVVQPGTQQYVDNIKKQISTMARTSSGGGSSRSVSVPQQANQTQEVIEQQMNQVRMMAGLDPNLISGMSISQISQLKRKELLERRQRAMERFNQLQREKRKVYN